MDFYDFIRAIEFLAERFNPLFDPKNKYPTVVNLVNNLYGQMM